MKQYFLIIAFIALIVLISTPVSAAYDADGCDILNLHESTCVKLGDIYPEESVTIAYPLSTFSAACVAKYGAGWDCSGTDHISTFFCKDVESLPTCFAQDDGHASSYSGYIRNNPVTYNGDYLQYQYLESYCACAGTSLPVEMGFLELHNHTSVTIPVTNFECVPMFQNISSDVVCSDISTNTPTSWLWEVIEPSGNAANYNTQDITWTIAELGWHNVTLTATNSAGSDTMIDQYGFKGVLTGNNTEYNVTPIPTIAPIPTGIPNNINISAWRESACNNTALGNTTQGYCNSVDNMQRSINESFSGIISIFTTPLDWIKIAVDQQNDIFQDVVTPLITQSSIFLQLIGRALVALPAAIINLVTLVLCIDVIRLVLRGPGGGT